jgi:hypothetical protein
MIVFFGPGPAKIHGQRGEAPQGAADALDFAAIMTVTVAPGFCCS